MSTLIPQESLGSALVKGFRVNARQYSMFIALIGIGLIFTILTNGTFITPRNLTNLLTQNAHIAILAVGMVLVIVAGHIDLSVGFVAGTCGALAALLQSVAHLPDIVAIGLAILLGLLVGLWQGWWIAYRNVPAFIVTLSGMLVFKGLVILVTQGKTLDLAGPDFKQLGIGYVPQIFMQGVVGKGVPFHDLTLILGLVMVMAFVFFSLRARRHREQYGFLVPSKAMQAFKIVVVSIFIMVFFGTLMLYRGLPWSILLVGILVGAYEVITRKTVFGRHVYAIGGNKEAARLSGIDIKQRTMMIFVSMGGLAALSGIVYTARLNAASASAGTGFELDAIAAAIIGGTSTVGGEGTITGAMIGALVMGSINNGMLLMNIPSEYQLIIKGLILLLAVWFDISTRSRKR